MEEFIQLSSQEQAEVLQEVIQELAIETQLPIRVILKMVSQHYKMKISRIKKLLALVNSPFIQNNNIIMYVKGEPIFRTNSNAILFKSLSKLKVCFDEEDSVDIQQVKVIIRDFYLEEELKKYES